MNLKLELQLSLLIPIKYHSLIIKNAKEKDLTVAEYILYLLTKINI